MTLNIIHPVRRIMFKDLYEGLERARSIGLVRRIYDQPTGRVLYCYTEKCVYDNGWNNITTLARGLIIHPDYQQIIATPFPKFFNVGEHGQPIPNLPFETYDKIDGSLIIIHHFGNGPFYGNDKWRCATKGAFTSSQALLAEQLLADLPTEVLTPGTTYLAELTDPKNPIVVRYSETALIFLGGYKKDGIELTNDELIDVATKLGVTVAQSHSYKEFAELISTVKAFPSTSEGVVVRFSDGTRLKIKGDEYRRIHALISRCTPIAMWEAMFANDDMLAIRRDLPEELWSDFDSITTLINNKLNQLIARIDEVVSSIRHLSDKEVGLTLKTYPDEIRSFLFPWRKSSGKIDGRLRETLYRAIRPTANVLEGYVPSSSMDQILDST